MTRPLCALLLAALLPSAPATAGQWPSLALRQDPDLLLEITTDDGAVRTGYPAPAGPDSVGLAARPGGPATAAVAGDEIVRLRQRRVATGRGWRTGGAIGAVGVGAAGTLFALLVSEISDENTWEDTVAPFAGVAVGGAAVGAVAGGGIGAMIGSGTEAWYEVEPAPPAAPLPWRLEPRAGLAAADDIGGTTYDDLHLGLFAPRRLATWLEAGPEAGWLRLGTYREHGDGRAAAVNDTWHAGAAARFTLPGGGVEPYLVLGLGWYHREDSWLGANWGVGVRIGRATAEVRNHQRSSGLDAEPTNGAMTVALGWSFDL